MSKGSKEARRRHKERQRQRQEKRTEMAALAWEKARNRPPAEQKLLEAFRSLPHTKEAPDPEHVEALPPVVCARAPKIVNRIAALWAVACLPWVRPLDEWVVTGKGAEAQFRSLVNHLIVKYPVPPFLYRVFETAGTNVCLQINARYLAHTRFFAHVAQGTSVYKLTKVPAYKGGLIVPLTKRMCHLFMQTPARCTFIEAVRQAQVSAFGGDHRLLRAIMGTRLGEGFQGENGAAEAFWMTVIQWFARHSMLDPNQIGPLLDYIIYLRRESIDFSIAGRSPLALLRGMERWHHELAHIKKLTGNTFNPSGFRPGTWERKRRMNNGNFVVTNWTMTEILGSKALAAEGRAMHHCVYSYGRSIESGNTSIWSLQKDSDRLLTIEVSNNHRRIVQVRGLYNCTAKPDEMQYVRSWAQQNDLTVAAYI